MNDMLLLWIGVVVFGLVLAGIALTIMEFKSMPRRQSPEFRGVAYQAQPERKESRSEGLQDAP